MALVDPYAPCHCGSGQKYKWCCQSVEAYIERSQRLLDNGQYELAINPLVEGLAKVPDNVSLAVAQGAGPASSESDRAGGRDLAPLAPETPGASGWFDLDDEARPGHRGCPGGRGPVSAGSFGPPVRRSLAARIAGLVPGFDAGSRGATPPRRSSISSLPPGSQARKPSRSPRISRICGSIRRSRSGRRIPIVSGRRPSRLRRHSANHSSGRSAGPRKGSGHRLPRPSNCWRRARAPA